MINFIGVTSLSNTVMVSKSTQSAQVASIAHYLGKIVVVVKNYGVLQVTIEAYANI